MSDHLASIREKIMDWESAARFRERCREEGKQVVFTNGCFDLLHYGHLHYLAEAAGLGEALIIGVNSAPSVSRLKGPHRPINDDHTRLWMLAAMAFVSSVVVFDQDTPLELINLLRPDVLVKGGDYAAGEIVGAATVLEHGGKVEVIPFIEGYSTTAIETKIRSSQTPDQ